MKYFLDTEFIEDGATIDLISIGIVSENNRQYYAINAECDYSKANDWVLKNVLKPMGLSREGFKKKSVDPLALANAKTKKQIAFEVLAFIKRLPGNETSLTYGDAHRLEVPEPIHFWGYYADYDWVVFCQLFGKMIDLPKGFPMYCRDIKQLCDELGNPELPKQTNGEHNALADAAWNKEAYKFLHALGRNRVYV